MDPQELSLRPNHRAFVERFVAACQTDDRIVAAFLGGSYAKGYEDAFSDVDLCVITTDRAFEEFLEEREVFLRSLGNLVFLEDFGLPHTAFYTFADGTEGELNFGCEGRLDQIHSGQFHPLLDKKNLLKGAEFPERVPDTSEQIKKLRSHIQGFWHEVSHFITAMQRGQIWWAQGQLESLRGICVNLARLRHNILDEEVGEEPYFKVEKAMPVDQLAPLKDTFCSFEKEEILQAGLILVRFYLEVAPPLAQMHGLQYSHGLERLMMDRLQKLSNSMR